MRCWFRWVYHFSVSFLKEIGILIKLDVDPWCHNCHMFEPVLADKPYTLFNNNEVGIVSDIIIRCENVEQCHFIKRIMEETDTRK